MTFSRPSLWHVLPTALLAVLLTACPRPGSGVNEEKDPYFLKGKQLVTSMDYEGAVNAFEKAIEVNPHSAASHLELGILYEEHLHDYAAAIYHFEKHLELRPDSAMADVVRDHVRACLIELVKSVDFAVKPPQVQQEINELAEENARLRAQVGDLKQQLEEQRLAILASSSPPETVSPTPSEAPPRLDPEPRRSISRSVQPLASPTERTHTIQRGDNFYRLSRLYGVSVDRIKAANPGVDPQSLRIGQSIRIPSR